MHREHLRPREIGGDDEHEGGDDGGGEDIVMCRFYDLMEINCVTKLICFN